MFHFTLLLFIIISTNNCYLNPKYLTYFVFKRHDPLRALEPMRSGKGTTIVALNIIIQLKV